MSFTNKNKSIMSRTYESLTRLARREREFWPPASPMSAYWVGYRDAVYSTLQKLSVELNSSGEDIDIATYRMLTRPAAYKEKTLR